MRRRLAYRTRTGWTGLVILAAVAAGAGPGCESETDRLDAIAARAPASPAQAAADLLDAMQRGRIGHDTAITATTERLQAGEDASAMAAAVLGALKGLRLKTDAEYELFWLGVGRLAFWGAHAAYSRGRVAEARAIVLAGPARWQTEAYWLMYPDHDALASFILADSGEHGEAVRRLRDRSDLAGEAEEALRALQSPPAR